MNVGDIVIFGGEKFTIQWIYESGYCELKHIEKVKNELVHISEIQVPKN